MSTDQQQYSTQNQSAAIAAYAAAHAMTIVKSYRDEGRSGVRIKGRRALQDLLADIRSGEKDYDVVLVYDVSRWGRFQNPDEAAYHEFVCNLGGVSVVYVAESFSNDGTPFSAVLKGLKRVMAGEYSRELSAKVYAGQCRLIGMGYRQGGSAGYGLRRMRLDALGRPRGILEHGQRKAVITDRVILVPGPMDEVRIVRRIFREFAAGMGAAAIARGLNAEAISFLDGKSWNNHRIRALLKNAKYVGDNVFGRTHGSFQLPRVNVPEDAWVMRKSSFKPLVSRQLFLKARERFEQMAKKSDEDVLSPLREILAREGQINSRLIREDRQAVSVPTLVRRFGGLRHVYRLIGFTPKKNLAYADARAHFLGVRESTMADVKAMFEQVGLPVTRQGWRLQIEHAWSLSVAVVRTSLYHETERWYVRQVPDDADIVIFVRLSADGSTIRDYVFWPAAIYGFIPENVSGRTYPAVAAYTSGSLLSLARCLGRGSVDAPPLDHATDIHGLAQRCRKRGQSISEALIIVEGFLELAKEGANFGALENAPEGDGETILRYVLLSRQGSVQLENAALVCWLARHHQAALTVLQWASDDLLTGMGG
ncbi:DNA invertase Pin-like site-specific DNA recombinase [Luteibacter jiangsuensis]|uniref:DNA invertase Pin-like site-specific DNA recombinase n=2 Tax=Luteibacter jiangsuensis TaxID=637577 RepID=A0ABT9SZU7_9GAMM|nr:DNA invertase Pin-like site-specific DNA recombinase [Luteibacter jiangsuensis]